ncbi:MAG: site-specific integrase [Bacteroides sp.]|nr:site-specific integrase [Bacteroides sp.]
MTSFRFHLRPSRREGQSPAFLFIRIIHQRKYKDLRREYTLYPHEWDSTSHTVRLCQADPSRLPYLKDLQEQMRKDLHLLRQITDLLGQKPEYTLGEIVEHFHSIQGEHTLLGFCRRLSGELTLAGRTRTARAYVSAVRSLVRFCQGKDIPLSEIDHRLMCNYEHHLLEKGLQMNTIAFYMRNLRTLYNKAIAARIIPARETNPFAEVFTGVYQTRRRSLTAEDMNTLYRLQQKLHRQINAMQGSSSPEALGRDPYYLHLDRLREALLYFMFAYHSRGMSFIDLACLKKSEINHQRIRYKRKKTGGYLEICITKPMRQIIRYFRKHTRSSGYVFPILTGSPVNQRITYETALSRQNKLLKELAVLAGINKKISTHVARHTWATLAKRMGYAVALISEGLGHRDTQVTSIYLASFERSAMDELSNKLSAIVQTA